MAEWRLSFVPLHVPHPTVCLSDHSNILLLTRQQRACQPASQKYNHVNHMADAFLRTVPPTLVEFARIKRWTLSKLISPPFIFIPISTPARLDVSSPTCYIWLDCAW